MSEATITYKIALAEYLSGTSDNISLFWKGRVALYALLKSYGIKKDDEIILPAFTCVVVPNAIIYCEAKPVYVDINPQTLNCDPEEIKKKITDRTKVIIAQNTFGLSSDLDGIMKIAREKNIIVIEDCTHGLGGFYKGKKNGTIADASFFSTQWNKPFSTGIGGMAFSSDKVIAEKMQKFEEEAIFPGFIERMQLSVLLKVRSIMKAPAIYWPMIKLYRFLSKNNLVVGSSQGNELETPSMSEGFLKKLAEVQAKKGISELIQLDTYNLHRIEISKKYNECLSSLKITPPFQPDYATHTFLKYPLLVKDRNEFLKLAEKENIELGDWFLSPIHPVVKDFEKWNYTMGAFPIAEYVSAHIVNLPTHPGMKESSILKICEFLNKNKSMLITE
ncbi:MAG: aminotransferase class I/II-fold pyridoxal phosphate-dependent enzyme [Bacteroidetes bacterium]|nr:aminotransferase class I/II-fold pyridoxal phosphate-dependent enzyme [Bacteroidota bacterium]